MMYVELVLLLLLLICYVCMYVCKGAVIRYLWGGRIILRRQTFFHKFFTGKTFFNMSAAVYLLEKQTFFSFEMEKQNFFF